MEIFFLLAFIGYIIDLLVGDPRGIPHPVVLIGKGIERLEKAARSVCASPTGLKMAGLVIALCIVAAAFGVTALVLHLLLMVGSPLYWLGGAWIVSSTIAARGLAEAAGQIKALLAVNDLPGARRQVGWIVGRDTSQMDNTEIVRATVETVAENINDAVVAPLFYACIGGPALAMTYRAVNTLDSMLGYKNDKYIDLGWASARLDDIAGYIPARITGVMLLCASWLSNRDWRRAIKAWRRDAAAHPSPNSGIPESVMAGSLGVRLGGTNVYGTYTSFRPHMGELIELLRPDHITRAVDMLYLASFITALFLPAILLVLGKLIFIARVF